MNNNKHIHDEDYDFSIKLIVPLLSILVCTICLCATTWAWYTASVSTGVNSITAKANVTENVSCGTDCTVQKTSNGKYVLEPGENNENKTYKVEFTLGEAANGYFALIDIEDGNTSAQTNTMSLIDLFVNRVYAESNDKKCVSISKGNTTSIEIEVNTIKTISIHYAWAVYKDGNPDLGDDDSYGTPISGKIDLKEVTQQTEPTTVTFNFINATTGEPLPYSALGIETYVLSEDIENQPQTATVVFEADSDEIEISAPTGYLLQMDESYGETDNVESRVYSIEADEDVVINVYCIEIPQNSVNDPIVQDPVPEGEANVIDTIPPDIENNTGESEISDTGASGDSDINESPSIPSTGENDSENKTTDSNSENTIESLLVTDPVDEETTEINPPSTEEPLEAGTSEE